MRMSKLSTVMFLAVAVAALGAVGVTTTLMTAQAAPSVPHGECHDNPGSSGCSGNFGGTICNKDHCQGTGPKP